MLIHVVIRKHRRGMKQSSEREWLRMMQNRRVLLERVQLSEMRRTSMMTLKIVMGVRRRINTHRVKSAVMMMVVVLLMVSHLVV